MKINEIFDIIFGFINVLILGATCVFIYQSKNKPLEAVKLGNKLTDTQFKENAKHNLFLTLFSLRGTPLHYDFVKSLNQIDVVFQDCQHRFLIVGISSLNLCIT
jgi:hypothetical protein